MADGPSIEPADLELERAGDEGFPTLKEARESAERTIIEQAIAATNGNVNQTAKLLGVARPTVYHLLKKYEIGDLPADAEAAQAEALDQEDVEADSTLRDEA